MTTEEFDLKAIKALIEKSQQLKKQVGILSQQVNSLGTERTQLLAQLLEQETSEKQTIATLNNTHQVAIAELNAQLNEKEKNNQQNIEDLKLTHQNLINELNLKSQTEQEALKQAHQQELLELQKSNEEKNTALITQWEQLKQQNHAVVSRIRGLSS